MTWWGEFLDATSKDPKRKNRFLIEFGNVENGYLLDAKSVSKPKVNIESKEYRMINHFYSYPGIAKWDPITITLVDNGNFTQNYKQRVNEDDDAESAEQKVITVNKTSDVLWEMLLAAGYSTPNGKSGISQRAKSISSPSKASTISNSFGEYIKIYQIDSNGKKTESWELYNPIITKISWGDLDYGDDGLVEYSLDIKYDWAVLFDGNIDAKNN